MLTYRVQCINLDTVPGTVQLYSIGPIRQALTVVDSEQARIEFILKMPGPRDLQAAPPNAAARKYREKTICCPLCNSSFAGPSGLHYHRIRYHGHKPRSYKKKPPKTRKNQKKKKQKKKNEKQKKKPKVLAQSGGCLACKGKPRVHTCGRVCASVKHSSTLKSGEGSLPTSPPPRLAPRRKLTSEFPPIPLPPIPLPPIPLDPLLVIRDMMMSYSNPGKHDPLLLVRRASMMMHPAALRFCRDPAPVSAPSPPAAILSLPSPPSPPSPSSPSSSFSARTFSARIEKGENMAIRDVEFIMPVARIPQSGIPKHSLLRGSRKHKILSPPPPASRPHTATKLAAVAVLRNPRNRPLDPHKLKQKFSPSISPGSADGGGSPESEARVAGPSCEASLANQPILSDHRMKRHGYNTRRSTKNDAVRAPTSGHVSDNAKISSKSESGDCPACTGKDRAHICGYKPRRYTKKEKKKSTQKEKNNRKRKRIASELESSSSAFTFQYNFPDETKQLSRSEAKNENEPSYVSENITESGKKRKLDLSSSTGVGPTRRISAHAYLHATFMKKFVGYGTWECTITEILSDGQRCLGSYTDGTKKMYTVEQVLIARRYRLRQK